MARIRSLSAPPIQEALIDFVISSRSLTEEELRELAESAKVDDTWLIEDVRRIEASLDVSDNPELISGSEGLEAVRARAADESVVVAFRPRRVTVSHVRSYHCWEDLEELALDCLHKFIAKSGDAPVERVGTRFINLLKPGAAVTDTLSAPPPSPIEGGLVTDFLDHRVIQLGNGTTVTVKQATVTHKVSDDAEPVRALLLDIDAFRECAVQPSDAQLSEVLRELRATKNQVFFGAVTETALESYQ